MPVVPEPTAPDRLAYEHGLGIPIVGDPLYPEVLDVSVDDFSTQLQLVASTLEIVDPVDGRERRFVSGRSLPIT